jgi:predicted nucleic acid-binding protein
MMRLCSSSLSGKLSDRLLFEPIDQPVAHTAARLRSEYNLNSLDAFQLAVALTSRRDAFLTNDLALRHVAALRVIVLDEIESPTAAT